MRAKKVLFKWRRSLFSKSCDFVRRNFGDTQPPTCFENVAETNTLWHKGQFLILSLLHYKWMRLRYTLVWYAFKYRFIYMISVVNELFQGYKNDPLYLLLLKDFLEMFHKAGFSLALWDLWAVSNTSWQRGKRHSEYCCAMSLASYRFGGRRHSSHSFIGGYYAQRVSSYESGQLIIWKIDIRFACRHSFCEIQSFGWNL